MSKIQENQVEHNKQVVDPALFEGLSFEELMEQAEAIINTDAAFAYKLTELAEDIAQQFGDDNKTARALSLKGASLYKQDKPRLAIEVLSEALGIARNPLVTCEISNRMSYSYSMLSEFKFTIMLAQEALKIAQDFDTKEGQKQQVFSYNCIGLAYHRLGIYDAATTAYLKGLEVADESDAQLMHLNGNLSLVQDSLGNFDAAFKYSQKALEFALYNKNEREQARTLGNIGYLYLGAENFEQAIDFAHQALTMEQLPIDAKLDQFRTLASAYSKLEKFDEAQEYIASAEKLLLEFRNDYCCCEILSCKAEIYYYQSEYLLAKSSFIEARVLAKKTNHLEELYKIHLNLSKVYEKLDEPKKALQNHKEFHQVKTQVYNDQAERRVQGLMIQHEVEELIKQNDLTAEENSRLEQLVHQRTIEIEEAHLEMLERLAIAGEKRDDDTGEHTARVGRVCGLIAKELGCDDVYVDTIKIAARLHDIGKIGVPDSILLKPQRLTEAEFEIVKTHAAIGAEMLTNSKSKLFQMAERIAGTHHERWDGRGYPNGIAAKDIPLEGRIVAVADVYDALTNDRPYKDTWTHEEALTELFTSADSHLDRTVVEAFNRLFEKGIITPADLCEKPKKKAKIHDAYDQEIFADDS